MKGGGGAHEYFAVNIVAFILNYTEGCCSDRYRRMAEGSDIPQFQSDVEVGPDIQTDYGTENISDQVIVDRTAGEVRLDIEGTPEAMKILVIGKTGAGKSSLINAFFGREVAEERDGVTPQQHETVEIHQGKVAGIDVTMVDTRGLGDSETKNKSILQEIKKFLNPAIEFDLILICVRIDIRIDQSSVDVMHDIAQICGGARFWKRAIIVLTFTNMFEYVLKAKYKKIQREEIIKKIAEEVQAVFVMLQKYLPNNAEIPFVNVGWRHSEETLSTSDDWLHDFFLCCINRCSEDKRVAMETIADVVGVTVLSAIGGGACVGAIGAGIGGVVGTLFFPGVGTVGGAALGAQYGAAFGSTTSGVFSLMAGTYEYVTSNPVFLK